MATVAVANNNDEKKRQQQQNSTGTNGSSMSGTVQQTTTKTTTSPYSGVQGLSTTTASKLGKLHQGYTPSQKVTDAQSYLDQIKANKPGEYQSKYSDQLESIYNKITNREPFEYDLNGDMLYKQYANQYTRQGQQAMMDTMGQAAALTGGYGSSYASTAGNQAYQQYLTQLNSVIPELYDRAYQKWQNEGTQLETQYNLAQNADATDYNRYQDQLSQWNTDVDRANNWYNTDYTNDYNEYTDALNYWTNLAQQENTDYYNAIDYRWQQEDRDAAAAAAAAASSGGYRTTKADTSTDGTDGLNFYERNLIDNADSVNNSVLSNQDYVQKLAALYAKEQAEEKAAAKSAASAASGYKGSIDINTVKNKKKT